MSETTVKCEICGEADRDNLFKVNADDSILCDKPNCLVEYMTGWQLEPLGDEDESEKTFRARAYRRGGDR